MAVLEAVVNAIATVGASIIDALDRHTEAVVNHMGAIDDLKQVGSDFRDEVFELQQTVSDFKDEIHNLLDKGINLNYGDPLGLDDERLARAIDNAANDITRAAKGLSAKVEL